MLKLTEFIVFSNLRSKYVETVKIYRILKFEVEVLKLSEFILFSINWGIVRQSHYSPYEIGANYKIYANELVWGNVRHF